MLRPPCVRSPLTGGIEDHAQFTRAPVQSRPRRSRHAHGLDGRQREIRGLAYLITIMTTDQMMGKARGHWPWFAGIVVLAAAAAAGVSYRAPSDSRPTRPAPPAIVYIRRIAVPHAISPVVRLI
jgi:hypothetical protein